MSEQGFRGVPGVPEGWELVGVRRISEDWTIGYDGKPMFYEGGLTTTWWPVIRKIDKPKQYRPFANAAEFEPHRNRWIKQSYIDDSCEVGCFRVHRYDDKGVYNVGEHFTYQEMFDDGKCFDDGTPFGIEVTE